MNVLDNLWTWQFLAGVIVGFVLSRAWCVVKVVWLDRIQPLPGGRHRSKWNAVAVDARWVAGAIGALFMVWSVVTTQQNADENQRIAASVQRCNAELIAAINGSREVTTDNDRLSQAERDLLAEGSRLGREWLGSLLDPPPDVDRLAPADPARQRYIVERTRIYFDQIGDVNRGISAVHAEQLRNQESRPALPDPSCPTR